MRFMLAVASVLVFSGCSAAEEDSSPQGRSPSTPTAGSGGGGAAAVGGTSSGSAGTAFGGATAAGGTGTAGTSTGFAGTTGSAGTLGSAGTVGSAGTTSTAVTCMTTVTATGTPALIDDLEDNNGAVIAADGRAGDWFFATDGTGTTTPVQGVPVPVDGGNPNKALHVSGSNLTVWGVSLAAAVVAPNGCYDATKYTGITLSLKGTGTVWVSVLTAAVRAAPVGQRNHFKKQVTLSGTWTDVPIKWSELTQPGGWGVIVPFDVTKIYGIDVGPDSATMPIAFDFWVDNLSFTTN